MPTYAKASVGDAAYAKASAGDAGVAQLVEHQLPKLRVASSSLVSRSLILKKMVN